MLLLQDPGAQAAVPAITLGEFMFHGGALMWPILVCSVVMLGLALERYLRLRRATVLPDDVLQQVEQLRQDRNAPLGEMAASPAARVLQAGARRRGHAIAEVEKAMEDQLAREHERLRGRIRGISLMATLSPLLGLLGTVVGIAEAFAGVELSGLGKPENLASGIKVALYTTIFGLCVAIPATILASHLQAVLRRCLIAIGDHVGPAADLLAARPTEQSHAA